ncbi:unnamed protein product [Rhizoctonia solani]|nr:unnamed protein product [Rhizoctonia solani]
MESPEGTHPIWGETLLEYPSLFVSRFYKTNDETQFECPVEFKEQLRIIDNHPSLVTVSLLEGVLRRARTWDFYEDFAGQKPLPGLMKILHMHCDSHKVFSHYYGFLCIQLLTTVMHVGTLDSDAPEVQALRQRLRENSTEHDNSLCLADTDSGMLWISLQDPSRGMQRAILMEAYNSIDGCYYLFYKTGGFSSQDALFLLEIIWADRKAFMMLCDSIGDEMPGWGILLMAIWHHIKDLEDPDILLKRLRNLLLRYALIVPDMEFSLVVSIAQQIEETASEKWPQTEELPPVDIDDCRNMLRAFNKYLNSAQASQDSGQIMAAPFWLVYRNAFSVLPDEIPLLIGAAIERVWKILADSAVSTISRIMASFKYAMSAMWALSLVLHTRDQTRRQRRTTATTWIKLMQDIHFMELIGRLCSVLVLSTEEGGNGFLISHDQLEEFTECVGALTPVPTERPIAHVDGAAGSIIVLFAVNLCTGAPVIQRHIEANVWAVVVNF